MQERLSVICDAVLQVGRGDLFADFAVHRLEEISDPVGPQPDANRHGMTAIAFEQSGGVAEDLHQIQAGHAAPGTVGDIPLNGENDGGPVVVAGQSGGDNADHPLVPVPPGDEQGIVALPGEMAFDLFTGLLIDLLFLVLSDPVEGFQL